MERWSMFLQIAAVYLCINGSRALFLRDPLDSFACQGDSAQLTCQQGHVIEISDYFYGRLKTHGDICIRGGNENMLEDCEIKNDTTKQEKIRNIKAACESKPSCSISTTEIKFIDIDSCHDNASAYIFAIYHCVQPASPTVRPLRDCLRGVDDECLPPPAAINNCNLTDKDEDDGLEFESSAGRHLSLYGMAALGAIALVVNCY